MSPLSTKDLGFSYGEDPLFRDLSVHVPPGKVTSLIGANGSGKSTLLRLLSRLLRPDSGAVLLDGASIHELPTRVVAQSLAVLPQGPEAPADLRVRELALLGRYPHRRGLGGPRREDRDAADRALARCGISELADRPLATLSGGQRQLAWISMALAQETGLLLLDEPTAALDVAHAIDVLDLLRGLSRDGSHTVVMALHDLNLAARYSDHLIAITPERSILPGTPQEVLTPDTLQRVFGVAFEVLKDPRSGAPVCLPYRKEP